MTDFGVNVVIEFVPPFDGLSPYLMAVLTS